VPSVRYSDAVPFVVRLPRCRLFFIACPLLFRYAAFTLVVPLPPFGYVAFVVGCRCLLRYCCCLFVRLLTLLLPLFRCSVCYHWNVDCRTLLTLLPLLRCLCLVIAGGVVGDWLLMMVPSVALRLPLFVTDDALAVVALLFPVVTCRSAILVNYCCCSVGALLRIAVVLFCNDSAICLVVPRCPFTLHAVAERSIR